MRFAELPSWLRRPFVLAMGAIFAWLVFFEGPAEAMRLNQSWGWPRWSGSLGRLLGGAFILLGVTAFVYSSGLFARIGKGTPVPAEPPKRLVSSGLFRYSRNPIYVAYAAVLVGEFLWFGHAALLGYIALYFLAVQAVILWWEEPVLRRRFGEDYAAYTQRVRRWL